jgi:hypothetical protein
MQQLLQRLGRSDLGLVERVQVQLERLRLDDVRRIGRNDERGQRHLRLALQVQPRYLVGIPDIHAEEGQRAPFRQADLRAFRLARDREQQ